VVRDKNRFRESGQIEPI
jgi:hypothetical protein